jgi:hypothetical protein
MSANEGMFVGGALLAVDYHFIEWADYSETSPGA